MSTPVDDGGETGVARRVRGLLGSGRRYVFVPNRCSDAGGTTMRVLGVDPGLTRCGLGVVEGAPAGR